MIGKQVLNRTLVAVMALAVAAGTTAAFAQVAKDVKSTAAGSKIKSSKSLTAKSAAPRAKSGAAGQTGGTDGASGAKIVVEEASHDFGEIWSGAPIQHTFEIKNEGTSVLKLTRVKPSCGCTVANQYDREIAPGTIGKIPVTIKSGKLRNKVSKSITVESNDSSNSPLRLTLTGTVKQRVSMDPVRGGAFGRIAADKDLNRVITLTNNTDSPVELDILGSATGGPFKAELKEIEKGQKYELIITGKAPFAEQNSRANFKLRTNIKDQPTIDIPVTAFVPPRVEIRPKDIIIPQASDKAATRNITVKFNTSDDLKVLSGTVDAENVSVEIERRANNQFKVTANFPANYVPPTKGHTLTLKTDDPKNAEIKVSIKRQRATPPRPTRPSMLLANKPAPKASFTMADGKTVSTDDFKGKVTLLKFYASWCGFCKRALPKLDVMRKDLDGTDFNLLAVSMDTIVAEPDPKNRRAVTREFVVDQFTKAGWDVPQAFDSNGDGRNKFKVQSFPTLFLIGKTGKVERVYMGGGAVNDGSLRKAIDDLLAGKKLPPQKVDTTTARTPPKRPALELKGKNAPNTAFTTTSGDSFPLIDGQNSTVAFFYASWCGYCKKALPKLDELSKSYEGKNVRFVGINQDTIVEQLDPNNRRGKTREQVVEQWKQLGASFPQIIDTEKMGRTQMKVTSFPTMFLISKTGKIEEVYVGGGAVNNGTLKKDIDKSIGLVSTK